MDQLGSELHGTSVLARPTGFRRARTHQRLRMIPIDGAEDWGAALGNSA